MSGTGRVCQNVKSVLFTCVDKYSHEKAPTFRLVFASFQILEIMIVEIC